MKKFEEKSTMRISIIVAKSKSGVIGKEGRIPWHIPEDMKHFQETTMGCPVIMGRKTWDSLPEKFKPLPGRFNIVITNRTTDYSCKYDEKYARFTWSPTTAIMYAYADAAITGTDVYIIGGASIYKEYLDMGVVERILVSEVKGDYSGDTYFPELQGEWVKKMIKEQNEFTIWELLRTAHNAASHL